MNTSKIVQYINNEREIRGLNIKNKDIEITSKFEGDDKNKNNYSLYIIVEKNNNTLFHLSIHLCIKWLNATHAGTFHFYKNIYQPKNKKNLKKKIKKTFNGLIYIKKIENKQTIPSNISGNKPTSLEFSIVDNSELGPYDREIKEESDVIITVLNRLFDQTNKEYYIGNKNKIYHIHKNTNHVLTNINSKTKYAKRKNKGTLLFPLSKTNETTIVKYKGKTQRKNRNKINLTNENLEKLNIKPWNL